MLIENDKYIIRTYEIADGYIYFIWSDGTVWKTKDFIQYFRESNVPS